MILSPFSSFIPTKNGEELLEAVVGINRAYNNLIRKTDDNQFHGIELSELIKESMMRVGEQFKKFEASGGYKHIHAALPNVGKEIQTLLMRNQVENLYLCSTNYDGIVDSLLTYYCKVEQKRKFIMKDGFINGRFYDWVFRRAQFKKAHLHGSYRYSRDINGTRKLDKGIVNSNPVMIYDDPNCKEGSIMGDPVLSSNFLELERQLKVCDRVITIGNSFKTEPHLLSLFQSQFNRPNTEMIVCSDKPDEVCSILETCYDYQIIQHYTKNLNSEDDLIKLFRRVLSNGASWSATA